jgi:hypothetical protein
MPWYPALLHPITYIATRECLCLHTLQRSQRLVATKATPMIRAIQNTAKHKAYFHVQFRWVGHVLCLFTVADSRLHHSIMHASDLCVCMVCTHARVSLMCVVVVLAHVVGNRLYIVCIHSVLQRLHASLLWYATPCVQCATQCQTIVLNTNYTFIVCLCYRCHC